MKNIYLIGMMGSGKTSTGKALSRLRQMLFVDLDLELERQQKRSIREIFEKEGESFFRKEESKILRTAGNALGAVISTGGGIILDSENQVWMKSHGIVVHLKTSLEWLWKRVKDKAHRPLLKSENPKGELEKILKHREAFYQGAHHVEVVTDGKTAEEVAFEIDEALRKKDL